nr:hypothetical protein [Tanacetum cinerariifolium]
VDIGNIIFSDLVSMLQDGKKGRDPNVCYTRFLSLMFEKLLGENYINDDLTLLKPYTILAASLKKPMASEVALTSHMLKVAKLLNELEKTLILSSVEVNVDDTADKSLSETNVVEIIMADSSRDVEVNEADSDLESMPDDEVSDEIAADNVLEELPDLANFKDAFADKPSLSDPLSHIHEEPNTLTNKVKVRKGMKEVRDKLKYCTRRIDQNSIHIKELVDLIYDMVHLLDSASVFCKANAVTNKTMARMDAMTMKIDARYKEMKSHT